MTMPQPEFIQKPVVERGFLKKKGGNKTGYRNRKNLRGFGNPGG